MAAALQPLRVRALEITTQTRLRHGINASIVASKRWQSTTVASLDKPSSASSKSFFEVDTPKKTISPLRRLSTVNLVRSLFLGSVFTVPLLYKTSMAMFTWVVNSKSAFLNPDKNFVLRAVIRSLIYNHFCAGTNAKEIRKTISDIKDMGYSGVILSCGREIIVDSSVPQTGLSGAASTAVDSHIKSWQEANIETLSVLGDGDYMALKFTGAGPKIGDALATGANPPQQLADAMEELCQQAAAQNSRIMVDAEQTTFQSTVDQWTADLMRKHNRNGKAIIYNTYQAYLKSCPNTLADHLRQAQKEDWSVGVKLVRGAYIESDVRERIHDTKQDTDACYDGIAENVLRKQYPGVEGKFPDVHLFIAGHNAESIRKASQIAKELTLSGKECATLQFGQLMGMADEISCELLETSESIKESEKQGEMQKQSAPETFKYLTWGTVQECMQYLLRRAVENQGGAERMKAGLADMRAELRRRISPF